MFLNCNENQLLLFQLMEQLCSKIKLYNVANGVLLGYVTYLFANPQNKDWQIITFRVNKLSCLPKNDYSWCRLSCSSVNSRVQRVYSSFSVIGWTKHQFKRYPSHCTEAEMNKALFWIVLPYLNIVPVFRKNIVNCLSSESYSALTLRTNL